MKNKKMILNLCFVFLLVSIVNVLYGVPYLRKYGIIIWAIAVSIIFFIAKKIGVGLEEGQTIRGKYKEQFFDKTFLWGFVVNTCLFVVVLAMYSQKQSEFINRFIDMIITFVLAACFEEILIRGLYFDEFRKKYSIFKCSLICGMIFAFLHIPQQILIVHLSFGEMISLFVTGTMKGALLCAIQVLTENIFITAICHLNSGLYTEFIGFLISIPLICIKIAQQQKRIEIEK